MKLTTNQALTLIVTFIFAFIIGLALLLMHISYEQEEEKRYACTSAGYSYEKVDEVFMGKRTVDVYECFKKEK